MKKHRQTRLFLLFFVYSVFSLFSLAKAADNVVIHDNQLFVDDVAEPQIFGAEIQYFRLRGGEGKNVPREKVLEVWNRALSKAKEAGMNAISFYIPWDFHEYKEGSFDFTGAVDEDGDGMPDYPSRDILTFFELIKQHGFKRIMVRPGPYINAEWGFLGFGAIPLWFHEKYPDSHMKNADGLYTKLYDYHSPDLLRHTHLWFNKLYEQVLKGKIGGNGPILFMQLDNETNFMWQSIQNHDYSDRAISRYREFLANQFISLEELNRQHGRNWQSYAEIQAPKTPGANINEDRSWYEFQDYSMYTYLQKLRKMWEEIGVKEPKLIFTLAESYNGLKNGILPNFKYRNTPNKTGMITMNLYPKTYELPQTTLMNLPFKADHDVKAMDAANDYYFANRSEWLMGPEIQGGWWRNVPVSEKSRQQTYLSVLGHGLKAIFIYYFTEGYNWQENWIKEQVTPIYDLLRNSVAYAYFDENELPHSFWRTLQAQVDRQVLFGIDVYRVMRDPEASSPILFFDAPLDHEANPRPHFELLKKFGNKIINPYQDFLAKSVRVTDPILIMKDNEAHAPSPVPGIDSMLLNADWEGGLVGYLAQVGISADIRHWNLNPMEDFFAAKMIFAHDNGITSKEKLSFYKQYMEKGGTVVSLLGHSLAQNLGYIEDAENNNSRDPIEVRSILGEYFEAAKEPVHTYKLKNEACEAILWFGNKIAAFKCKRGHGTFIQIGILTHDIYNSDYYGQIKDNRSRINFLKSIFENSNISPLLQISGAEQISAFARKDFESKALWITVKNGKAEDTEFTVKLSPELLAQLSGYDQTQRYLLRSPLSGNSKVINISEDLFLNIRDKIKSHDSLVYFIQAMD